MNNNERSDSNANPGGMPDIPLEILEAFKNNSLDFETAYRDANHDHASIMSWLHVEAERRRLSPDQKRGFIMGALSLIGLYDFSEEYKRVITPLEEMLVQPAYTDSHHTDPPEGT